MINFIHFGPSKELLSSLNEIAKTGRFGAIFGEEATGKTYLVEYWAKKQHPLAELRPCLYVDLWRTQRATFDRGTYVTPITCVLFNEILYQMADISWTHAREIMNSRWFQPTGTLSTDRNFLAMMNFTRKFYSRLSARLLIVDGAQLLDTSALDLLIRLRNTQREPTGIIFISTLEKNETSPNAIDRFERKLPHKSRSLFHRSNAHALLRLEAKEFVETVLKAMFEQLEVDTTAETPAETARKEHIARRAWQRTQGDWVSIRGLFEDLEMALGPKKGKPRRLTSEVLQKVFSDWKEPGV